MGTKKNESDEAYVICPVGANHLVLTALDEMGVYYAAQTLRQLLESKHAKGRVTIIDCSFFVRSY